MARMSEPGARRDPYAEVCQAGRQAIDRAFRWGVTPLELRALVIVVDLTVMWSLFDAYTTTTWIACRVYGVDPDTVSRDQRLRVGAALRRLKALGIIRHETTQGRRASTRVGVPPLGEEGGAYAQRKEVVVNHEGGAPTQRKEARARDTYEEGYEDDYEDLFPSTRSSSGQTKAEQF